jgi:hypothetical protein|tara:strand:+ start:589 stop:897 length:309 start_codon:yes stop_codon:yes gene_type:complete
MSKKICEKSLFNILFYRKHKAFFTGNEKSYMNIYINNSHYDKSLYNWIDKQSNEIDSMGFKNWVNNTDGPLGPSNFLYKAHYPYYYTIHTPMISVKSTKYQT